MKTLLIGTTNPGKYREISFALSPLLANGIKLLSLSDLKIADDPEETGKTFEENAKLKATYYGRKTNLPTLADDGGLVIPALGGAPGVISRRWPGHKSTDQELIDYCLLQMKNIPDPKRTAYFEVFITVFFPDKNIYINSQESIKGKIAKKPIPLISKGYPYRALFVVDKYKKYYDNLSQKEHDMVNHRRKAIARLVPEIKNNFLV